MLSEFHSLARFGQEGVWTLQVSGGRVAAWIPQSGGQASGTLLPGFVDAHCHILPMGLDLQKLHLGNCTTKQEVLQAVREQHQALESEKWLMAVHYDQTKFADGTHLTLTDLDSITRSRPILLRHSNGHASIANSAALAAAQVDDSTPNPDGGEFVRDADGRLSGVLLEHAHEIVTSAAPSPTLEEMVDAILRAGDLMSALGITCATDMMTGRWSLDAELQAYRAASERGCKIRLRLFVQWRDLFGRRAIDPSRYKDLTASMNPALCRVEGVKIFADGAIGSATAAIYGRFLTNEMPSDENTDGVLNYEPERLLEMIKTADAAGHRIAIHSIGDHATDLVMAAYKRTQDPKRHRIEHAMILSDKQIERMASLGCHCTMQPEFLLRFGHAYAKQLGPERAFRIKRLRSVLDAGVPLSLSSDRPIVPGDPWDGIRSAVERPTGFDPAESITLDEAITGYTAMGGIANGDPDQGTLAVGSRADFQVYDSTPSASPPTAVYVAGVKQSI